MIRLNCDLGIAIGRLAPTEDRKRSRSGDRSYRRGVGFYRIRGRDREIAPTEEGNLKFYLTFLFK